MRPSLLVLIPAALACSSAVATGRSDQASPEELVWSHLLSEIAGDEHRLLVVSDSTSSVAPDEAWGRLLLEELPELREETLQGIRDAAAMARAMPRFTGLVVPVELASSEELAVLRRDRNPDEYWRAFYERYPDSPGLVQFSSVGFDPSREQALVYVHRSCGGRCGSGRYVLLSRSGEQWDVVDEYVAIVH